MVYASGDKECKLGLSSYKLKDLRGINANGVEGVAAGAQLR
jgi:hypothetical protein